MNGKIGYCEEGKGGGKGGRGRRKKEEGESIEARTEKKEGKRGRRREERGRRRGGEGGKRGGKRGRGGRRRREGKRGGRKGGKREGGKEERRKRKEKGGVFYGTQRVLFARVLFKRAAGAKFFGTKPNGLLGFLGRWVKVGVRVRCSALPLNFLISLARLLSSFFLSLSLLSGDCVS